MFYNFYFITAKKLFELIEPVETRVQSVRDFLTDINPGIEYNVLPIQDMYGPTKEDPRFQVWYAIHYFFLGITTRF